MGQGEGACPLPLPLAAAERGEIRKVLIFRGIQQGSEHWWSCCLLVSGTVWVLLWCWYSGITSICHVFLLWGADCLVSPREKHCFVLAGGVSASQGGWSCPSLFVPLRCDFVTRVQNHHSFWSENGFAAFSPCNRSCTFFFANQWQGCAYGY